MASYRLSNSLQRSCTEQSCMLRVRALFFSYSVNMALEVLSMHQAQASLISGFHKA